MDKLMDTPWFLRLTALFLAIVMFVSVKMSVENNTVGDAQDVIRDIPVDVFYDNENLVVTGVPEKVDMTIDGPANMVQSTKLLKDFTLKVDLRDLPLGRHTVRIKSENISEKLRVRIDPATIDVVIEEKITQTFRVDPELNERLLAEDFHVGKMDVIPQTIEVTGAKSVIEAISFVKASVTGEKGINKSFEQKARVRVLDRDLTKLNVTIVPEQVTVKVEVAEYYKEVPLVLKGRGVPSADVTIDSITAEEKTIRLSGPRKVLDLISEFSADVDVSEVKGPGTLDVELKKPKGVSQMSLNKIKVKIEATVSDTVSDSDVSVDIEETNPDMPVDGEQIATKEFQNVPIVVKGLDEKFNSSFMKPTDGLVVLTVTAEQTVIDALKQSDFMVYIDASGTMDEGEKVLLVSVEGPPDVRWKLSDGEVTMQIELA
ncbi:YbbR-like domain-containing protein [Sporosarcina sp. YIM B06819]|uniref:CdaR family protein n=1 Tax=Sporosarcina sp. YIM B06819 TaxID=3081769 RepID=UPI00298D5457|nr:CdaR family protein [Sporosarcina sp. YIM B06819]